MSIVINQGEFRNMSFINNDQNYEWYQSKRKLPKKLVWSANYLVFIFAIITNLFDSQNSCWRYNFATFVRQFVRILLAQYPI